MNNKRYIPIIIDKEREKEKENESYSFDAPYPMLFYSTYSSFLSFLAKEYERMKKF